MTDGRRIITAQTVAGRAGCRNSVARRVAKKEVSLGEKKEIVRRYMVQGLKRDKALAICRVSKNQFYYRPEAGKPGRKLSRHTLQMVNGEVVRRDNKYVGHYMKSQFDNPLTDYGYHRMTGTLQLAGFYINHKKVYRLMKEGRLLNRQQPKMSKQYVKYRVVCPEGPLRLMEVDIKQVWLEGQRRYVYVLTILGVFTRSVLHWSVGYSIKQEQVQEAWQQVIEEHLEPAGALAWELHIEVRNDNGPQFSAKKLRQFLRNNYFVETFTHPYTPQENGHIESFHSIVTKALRGQYFENLAGITAWLACFYRNYNYERIHGNTLNLPPLHFCRDFVPAGFDVAHRSFVGISFSTRKPVGIADIVESIEPLPTPIGVAVRFAHIVTFKNGEIKTLEEVAGKVYCFFEIAQ